jgi:hypothetical protein
MACAPSAENTGTNAGVNRPNAAAAQSNAGANYLQSANAYTTASNSALGNLKPSVGKTASEIKLWNNKDVGPRLAKLMGADYARMKKFWNTETPIERFGDFLMITGCERNNCEANKYVIFMDMGNSDINVLHVGKDTLKEWKEYREIELPPPFAKERAALKSRK